MVPDEWRKCHLIDILNGQIKNGYSPNAADVETGYWVMGLGILGDNSCNFAEIKPVYPTPKVLQNLLYKDDFLISRSNTPDKVGRSMRFKGELSNCSYPDLMMRFRIDEKKADLKFIEAKLKSAPVRSYFKSCAAGSSSTMVKINKTIVEKIPLLLPPLNEQRKIAEILSTWDKAITTTEKLLTNSKQQKKSLMQQLLTGKKRFSGFNEDWKEKIISDFGKVVTGNTPLKSIEKNYGGSICWATAEDFKSKYINDTCIKLTKQGALKARILPEGSVLITCIASIGKNAIARTKMGTNQQINAVIINTENSNEYFYYLMEFHKKTLIALAGTTAVPILNKSSFEKIKVKAPAFEEQKKIADLLSNIDAQSEKLRTQLVRFQSEKKALMQQLLTGKKRITL